MSRKEAVLLAGRALAIIQFVAALLDISYLPERLVSLSHYQHMGTALAGTEAEYFQTLGRVGIAFMMMRIAGLLILAAIFWNCGRWLESILSPRRDRKEQAD
jgi:hypothetical protein